MTTKTILNRPKKVRIAHRFYSVKYVEEVIHEQQQCNGLCLFHEAEILVRNDLTYDLLAETFVHECLHGMNLEAGITDGMDEETITTMTAKSLCRFYQDNPSAMRWTFALLRAAGKK